MMASVQMGFLNLGLNGGLLPNYPPNSYFLVHEFSISQRPNSLVTSNSITAKKNWNFVRRKPKPSKVGFGTALSCIDIKEIFNFDGEKPKFCTISALGSGEVDARSTTVQFVEKELKFSPSFQDYLNVMESVRTDRSKNPSEKVNAVTPQKRTVKRKTSNRAWEKPNSREGKLIYRGREKDSTRKRHGDVERRGSGWGLVERILEKKTSGKGGNPLKDEKNSLSKELNGGGDIVDNDHFEREGAGFSNLKEQNRREFRRVHEVKISSRSKDALERKSSDRFNEFKRDVSGSEKVYVKKGNHVSNGRGEVGLDEMKSSEGRKVYEGKVERKMVELENSKNFTSRKAFVRSNSGRKFDESAVAKTLYQNDSFTNMSNQSYGSEVGSVGRNDQSFLRLEHRTGNDMDVLEKEIRGQDPSRRHVAFQDKTKKFAKFDSRANGKSNIRLDKVGGQKIGGVDYEDRAAFRTFEVFTDVRNRPRVLRMEMEERIQKLAKRLNATDVDMPEWQFSKMMHGANIKFTEHSILRVVQILGALGNWKRTLQVVQWLSRYIYTSVLDVLGKAKRPTEALNIFYTMRKELSSYPDLAAYHCIAVTLGQAGLMKDLFDVIDCMRAPPEKNFKLGLLQKWDPRLEPDLVIYHAVLNACVQQKQWEGAFWVIQQLKQQNIRPTNTTYGLIMEVMLVCGKYNLVHEFFRKVEKTSIPSALNYKVLVNTLWREGKVDEAVLAVQEMERRGVVGSASLYYDLARCLCSAGRCQEALLLVDKICKVAKKPLVVTYTGLIQACLDSGSIENGAYIFNKMHKFCAPNTVTCNIMLKSYIQHGMIQEAKDLFQTILDSSHQIKSKNDTDQKAIPDKFTFNTMMDACAAMNNWDYLLYTYEQMLRHGYHFDSRRHLRLVFDAFRAGKRQVIETTWEHLIRFGRAPPPPLVKERFCIKLEEDDHFGAISCIEVYQGSDFHAFSEKSWLNLLQGNAHRFRNVTVSRLTRELKHLINENDGPCHLYQNLLNVCTKLSEVTDVS
ncbi:uncharacterized protein A4U43_C06F440 [Asparagus officinalis]|uniref:Pentacotripeptide-repeat region of PRORP domain-containing protein n=1 Tax=Asparagus officinalis TaxID=4686 RepID=A0A5P1ENX9_ASPOF|nr:uncharacterized protein A4U43_C06F440 [Asparagus officinalis]